MESAARVSPDACQRQLTQHPELDALVKPAARVSSGVSKSPRLNQVRRRRASHPLRQESPDA